MKKVIINHSVENFDAWKDLFDSHDPVRKQFGITNEQVFQKHGNPNNVLVVAQYASREEAEKFFHSPDLIEAMQKGGVTGAPDVFFID